MQLFVEQVLNGVANGVVYGSVALALVLIFRTTGVLNFAQGEMALFATFISWKLTQQGLPVVGAIAVSMAIAFVSGAVIERVLIRPVESARDQAVAAGITINGLPIVNDRPNPWGSLPPKDLDRYFEDRVIGGPGAFIVVAKDYTAFASAILSKLLLEIAGGAPPQVQAAAAP